MSKYEIPEPTNFLNTTNENVLAFLWLSTLIKNIKTTLGSLFLIVLTGTAAFLPLPEAVWLWSFWERCFQEMFSFYFESMTITSSTTFELKWKCNGFK